MALTGQSCDLDPKTFTLANMFAMQLHKYKEDIAKVTSSALKELTIENELKKLAESWKEQRFDLHKYTTVGGCWQAGGGMELCQGTAGDYYALTCPTPRVSLSACTPACWCHQLLTVCHADRFCCCCLCRTVLTGAGCSRVLRR